LLPRVRERAVRWQMDVLHVRCGRARDREQPAQPKSPFAASEPNDGSGRVVADADCPRPRGQKTWGIAPKGAEATTLRAYLTQLLAGAGQTTPAILLGDLSDDPQAATTQILLGPPGSEIGTPGETIPDQGDTTRLFNLAPKLPPDQQYSRIYRGCRELIDHILISHALLAAPSACRAAPASPPDPNCARSATTRRSPTPPPARTTPPSRHGSTRDRRSQRRFRCSGSHLGRAAGGIWGQRR
jgi:hypothetical protein